MRTDHPQRRRVVWIIVTQGLQRLSGLIVPLAVTPYALRKLGSNEYGSWLLATALAGYAGLNLGIPQVLVDETARAMRRDDGRHAARVIHHGLALLALLAGVILVMVWPLSAWVHTGTQESASLVSVALICAAVSIPFAGLRGLTEGLQDVHELNVASSIAVLVAAPLTFLLLYKTGSVFCLFIPPFAANALGPALVLVRLLRKYPWLRMPGPWSWEVARQVLRGGGWYTLMAAAWTLIYNADIWVIKLTSGLVNVAPYALAFALFGALGEPVGALVMAIRPVAAKLAATSSDAASLFRRAMRLSTVAGMVLTSLGLLWFGVLMDLWIGPAARPDFRVAAFLASFQAVRAMLNAAAWTLAPVEGPKPLALALAGDAFINLSASILLGYRFGPWGVAAGSLIGMLACSAWYIPRRASLRFGVPVYGRWMWGTISVAPFWLAALFFQPRMGEFQRPGGPLLLAVLMSASAVLGGAIVYVVGLETEEKKWVAQMVSSDIF